MKKGWLRRLIGAASQEEMEGICLDAEKPYWEVGGPSTFEELFNALKKWVPDDALLYFEGEPQDDEIYDFFKMHAVPEISHVAMGTIWPHPQVFHVPATETLLSELARIMRNHAAPELASHFHVYRNDTVMLQWHDAFDSPMLMDGDIPEEDVRAFADKIGTNYRRIMGQDPPADADSPHG